MLITPFQKNSAIVIMYSLGNENAIQTLNETREFCGFFAIRSQKIDSCKKESKELIEIF